MPATRTSAPATPRAFARGPARAFAGALIFGLPMLMTSELWELGARLDRLKLALLVLLAIPLLVGVAHRVGFEPTFGWREDLRDAALALGVGMLASGTILFLFSLRLGRLDHPDGARGPGRHHAAGLRPGVRAAPSRHPRQLGDQEEQARR
jgi:hypothetical protein